MVYFNFLPTPDGPERTERREGDIIRHVIFPPLSLSLGGYKTPFNMASVVMESQLLSIRGLAL